MLPYSQKTKTLRIFFWLALLSFPFTLDPKTHSTSIFAKSETEADDRLAGKSCA